MLNSSADLLADSSHESAPKLPTKLKDLVWPSLGRYLEMMEDQLIMMFKTNPIVEPVTVQYNVMMRCIK
jgi:hypothetical protein